MGFFGLLFRRVLPAILIMLAVTIGWLAKQESPMGVFFATLVPLMKGKLPPTIVGHGKMKGTPPVPDSQPIESRPKNEQFRDLPGGFQMPANGLGMCCRPTAYDDVLVRRTVLWYLLMGGRHIDGAYVYLNHRAIGLGIKDAIRRGVPREEIFVTSKLLPNDFGYNRTMELVPKYLEELGLDYMDLVLMHGPSVFPMMGNDCIKAGVDAADCRIETWRALSELRDKGVMRSVGVSNFSVKHIQDIKDLGLAPIANNQIQFSPFVPAKVQETFDYCMEHGISVTAYSPLGGLEHDKAKAVETLQTLADKYNVRVAQIMLRWALQRGAAVIPGTGNPKHMRENLAVYNFELSNEDMATISGLKHNDEAKKFMYLDMSSMA